MFSRLLRGLGALFGSPPPPPPTSTPTPVEEPAAAPPATLSEALAAAGLSFSAWMAQRAAAPRQFPALTPERAGELAAAFPGPAQATLAVAERVLEHRFDLLGSGPFVPDDPDRSPRENGYRPIDWYLDPAHNLRFPVKVPYKEWNLYEMRPENADVKYPWELARCQHWPLLGQAFLLSGEERFAVEILDQADDFMEANPVGLGVNWTCTMDVAIRAANWAVALEMIRGADCFTERGEGALDALYRQGRFIFDNLENHYEITSNHYLSNVVGLYYVTALFAELEPAPLWLDFCLKALEREIDVQVLADGMDFESAVPYHRLVTELFLGSLRLARFRGDALSDAYREKLLLMMEFLAGTLRPDGLMPVIGDADDGRLHILSEYGTWNRQDPRHILAAAGSILKRPDWLAMAPETSRWEAGWWGLDAAPGLAEPPPPQVQLFPDAGIAVARGAAHYLAVTNSIVGAAGFGNHKHNDQLAFELHLRGMPLLIDPGSFVYTSDFDARNLFRGTAYHNTLMIDGVEQNEMNPEWIFRLFEKAYARHLHFKTGEGYVEYRGCHQGYTRLEEPVMHERTLRLLPDAEALLIFDRLTANEPCDLHWHFHLAPGIEATIDDNDAVLLTGPRGSFQLHADLRDTSEVSLESVWHSPSYGARESCLGVDFRRKGATDTEFTFVIAPPGWYEQSANQALIDAFEAEALAEPMAEPIIPPEGGP